MTIKQQGGIFGRNPTFNDVTIDGTLTTSGAQSVDELNVDNVNINGNTVSATNTDGDLGLNTDGTGAINLFGGLGSIKKLFGSSIEIQSDLVMMLKAGTNSRYLYLDLDGPPAQFYPEPTATINLGASTKKWNNLYLDGNVIVSSGSGIDFSATSDGGTVESELLNDYEDGYYTATLTPATSGTITLNTGYNKLAYTKVGRLVTVGGHLYVSSSSSPVGSTVDVNLPFTVAAPGTGAINRAAAWSGIAVTSDGAASVLHLTGANATSITLQVDASTIGGTYNFRFGFSYIAA